MSGYRVERPGQTKKKRDRIPPAPGGYVVTAPGMTHRLSKVTRALPQSYAPRAEPEPKELDPLELINNYIYRMEKAGIPVPELITHPGQEPPKDKWSGGFWSDIWAGLTSAGNAIVKTVNAPANAIMGAVTELGRMEDAHFKRRLSEMANEAERRGASQKVVQGLREKSAQPTPGGEPAADFFSAVGRGLKQGFLNQEQYSGAQFLRESGSQMPDWANTILGLGVDVIADPLTYVGVGALTKATKKGERLIGAIDKVIDAADDLRTLSTGRKLLSQAGKLAQAADKPSDIARDVKRFSALAKNVAVKHADDISDDLLKTLSKSAKAADQLADVVKPGKLYQLAKAPTRAAQAVAGQRPLLSVFGQPVVEGTSLMKHIPAVGQKVAKGLGISHLKGLQADIMRQVDVGNNLVLAARNLGKYADEMAALGKKGSRVLDEVTDLARNATRAVPVHQRLSLLQRLIPDLIDESGEAMSKGLRKTLNEVVKNTNEFLDVIPDVFPGVARGIDDARVKGIRLWNPITERQLMRATVGIESLPHAADQYVREIMEPVQLAERNFAKKLRQAGVNSKDAWDEIAHYIEDPAYSTSKEALKPVEEGMREMAERYSLLYDHLLALEQTAGIPVKELTEQTTGIMRYFPHRKPMEKGLGKGGRPGFLQTRTMRGTLAETEEMLGKRLFEESAPIVAARRVTESAKLMALDDVMRQLSEVQDVLGTELVRRVGTEETLEAGWKRVADLPWVVPEKYADEIINATRRVADPKPFFKYLNAATGPWRIFATVLNPGFHMRNRISNWWNMWVAYGPGVLNPKLRGELHHIKKAFSEGRLDEAIPGVLGKKVTVGEFMNAMERAGASDFAAHGAWSVMSEPSVVKQAEEIVRNYFPKVKKVALRANPLSQEFILAQLGRKLGRFIEENDRLVTALYVLKQTGSMDEAIMGMKKVLFDYNNLSNLEKNVLRSIMPFYTWTRNNIPYQIEKMLEQPGKYLAIGKTKRALEDWSAIEGRQYTPDYFQRLWAMPMPFRISGEPVYWNPDLPWQDLAMFQSPKELGQTAWGMLNPWLKVPLEKMFNKELFLGRTIKENEWSRVPAQFPFNLLGGVLGLPKMPNPYDRSRQIYSMDPWYAYLVRQIPFLANVGKWTTAPSRGGDPTKYITDLLSTLGGVKFFPFDYEGRRTQANWQNVRRLQDYMNELAKQQGVRLPTLDEIAEQERYEFISRQTGVPVEDIRYAMSLEKLPKFEGLFVDSPLTEAEKYATSEYDKIKDILAYMAKTGVAQPRDIPPSAFMQEFYSTMPGAEPTQIASILELLREKELEEFLKSLDFRKTVGPSKSMQSYFRKLGMNTPW